MGEPGHEDLHYGSLGSIEYRVNTNIWTSQRLPIQSSTLRPIERLVHRNSHDLDDALDKALNHDSAHRTAAIDVLCHDYPEMAAGDPCLQEMVHSSAYSQNTSRSCGLVSFGRAYGFGGHSKEPVSIIAFPSGSASDRLYLDELRLRQRGWTYSTESIPHTTFSSTELASSSEPAWICPTGPICQVNFSDSTEDRFTLLAVRSFAAIHIFRPLPGIRSVHSHSIEPGHILELKQGELFDCPCSDIQFNPWYQHQFITVDVCGRFKILEISKHRSRGKHSTRLVLAGELSNDVAVKNDDEKGRKMVNVDQPSQPTRADKTRQQLRVDETPHAVFWMGPEIFVIFRDDTVCAFIAAAPTLITVNLTMEISPKKMKIADAKKSPFVTDEVFVLTSSHVLLTRLEGQAPEARFTVRKKWRHYFNASHLHLRLAFRGTAHTKTQGLVLFSSKTSMIIEYDLARLHENDEVLQCIATNPSLLINPNDAADISLLSENGLTDFHVFNLPWLKLEQSAMPVDDDDESAFLEGADAFQTFTLDRSLSLSSHICLSWTDGRRPQKAPPTNWAQVVHRNKPRPMKTANLEDFVVEDDEPTYGLDENPARIEAFEDLYIEHSSEDDEGEYDSDSSSTSSAASWHWMRRPTAVQASTAPFESVYQASALGDLNDNDTDLVDALREISSRTEEELVGSFLTDGMMAAALQTLSIADIDDASNLLSQAAAQGFLSLTPLASSKALQLGHFGQTNIVEPSVSTIYANLVQRYILPLRPAINPRIRIRLDNAARSVAASLWFSSHRLLPSDKASPDTHSQTGGYPVGSSQTLPSSNPYPYLNPPTQDSMAFSQPATQLPSAVVPPEPSAGSDQAYSNLSKYTSFTKTVARSEGAASILAHWDLGVDPSTYNWRETSAKLAGTKYTQGSSLTDEAQAKRQRHEQREAERAAKRARRETWLREAAGQYQSQSQGPGFGRGAMSLQTLPVRSETRSQSQAPVLRGHSQAQVQAQRKPQPQSQTQPAVQPRSPVRAQAEAQTQTQTQFQAQAQTQTPAHAQPQLQTSQSQTARPATASQVEPGKFGARPTLNKLVLGRRKRAGF